LWDEHPPHPPPEDGVKPDEVFAAKAENFLRTLAEPHCGQTISADAERTSLSNSAWQSRQTNSKIGTTAS
jgi:hypothetical protein